MRERKEIQKVLLECSRGGEMISPDTAISIALQDVARELSEKLEEIAGERTAFSLVVFNSDPKAPVNYISNCKRSEVATAFEELLA